jgi:lipopolysaccharide export system permease protein
LDYAWHYSFGFRALVDSCFIASGDHLYLVLSNRLAHFEKTVLAAMENSMKLIDRYLATTIIHTTLIVLAMLIGVTIFISLIQEINDIGNGSYGFLAALEYVFLTLPQQVYSFFPMAMLVGVSMGLGLLANHSELTVLRASGVSLAKITWAVMKAAIFLLIIATIIGEWLGPITDHFAENQKTALTSKGQAIETSQGTWIRDGQNFLYINSITKNRHLQGISRYQFDKQGNLVEVSYAQNGDYQQGVWVMQNVVTSHISVKQVTTSSEASTKWQLSVKPKVLRISAVDPSEMSLKELVEYLSYLKQNNLNRDTYALAFWQRVLQPLATLIMVWLAIPFVFGSLRTISMGVRMMMGIMLGFTFYLLNEFFGPLSIVYRLSPFLAALIPMLLFAVGAYFLQRRVR